MTLSRYDHVEKKVFGPGALAFGRIVTALVAMVPLVGMGLLCFAFSLPVSRVPAEPELAGSAAGQWLFGVAIAAAVVGGVGLALNRLMVGIPFLLASAALIVGGIVL